MLNKTILVFYIDVGNLSYEESKNLLSNVRNMIKPKDGDENNVIQYVIPVRDQQTRVECLNAPTFISSEKFSADIIEKLEATDRKLERITSCINAQNEMRTVIVEKI